LFRYDPVEKPLREADEFLLGIRCLEERGCSLIETRSL